MPIGATKSSRLLIALAIFCFGVVLGILPVILVSLGLEAVQAAGQLLFWLAVMCCIIGASVAISHLIKIEAVGELTLPMFGERWPLEIQGALIVLVLFMVAGGAVVFGTKLHLRFDHHSKYISLQGEHKELNDELDDVKAERDQLAKDKQALTNILTGPNVQNVHLLELAVSCGKGSFRRITTWNAKTPDGPKDYNAVEVPLPVNLTRQDFELVGSNKRLEAIMVTLAVKENGVILSEISLDEQTELKEICARFLRDLQEERGPIRGEDESTQKANR